MAIWFKTPTPEEAQKLHSQTMVSMLGIDINANHICPVSSGHVTAVARPIHIERKTQVWGIQISDNKNRLVCESRLTIAVVEKQPTP